MTEIYLIRHAQAEGNRYRIMQGHWDGGVTELGRRQIELLRQRLQPLPFDAVYSSDLYRAMLTASAAYAPQGLPLHTDPALREINVGPWETRFFGNVFHDEPASAELFIHDSEHWQHEGAETFRQVAERAYAALEAIARRHEGGRVAVFSHGVTIRCLLSKILGAELRDRETVPIVQNTAVNILRCQGGRWEVAVLNDVSHLASLGQPAWGDRPTLRHEPLDPRRDRDFYISCYRDAWQTVHGDLDGFFGELYWNAALEHLGEDPEAVLRLLDGETPVGLIDMDPHRGAHAGYGWLSLLYLLPEQRGRGLAIQALARPLVHFRAKGRRSLRLVVAEHNAAARGLYAREGFRELSREPGSHGDLLLLERSLIERRELP